MKLIPQKPNGRATIRWKMHNPNFNLFDWSTVWRTDIWTGDSI